jgi:hypothetical protein
MFAPCKLYVYSCFSNVNPIIKNMTKVRPEVSVGLSKKGLRELNKRLKPLKGSLYPLVMTELKGAEYSRTAVYRVLRGDYRNDSIIAACTKVAERFEKRRSILDRKAKATDRLNIKEA